MIRYAASLAAIALIGSCRDAGRSDTGAVAGKITVTEQYNKVFKPENMPIYLLGGMEVLDREHEALGKKIAAELGDRSAIEARTERLGVKKYVDIANSLFSRHVAKEAKTDSGGRYRMTGVPPGKYRLLFSYSTAGMDPYSSEVVQKHYHWFFDVDVKAGETLKLDLNKYNARGKPYWDII